MIKEIGYSNGLVEKRLLQEPSTPWHVDVNPKVATIASIVQQSKPEIVRVVCLEE